MVGVLSHPLTDRSMADSKRVVRPDLLKELTSPPSGKVESFMPIGRLRRVVRSKVLVSSQVGEAAISLDRTPFDVDTF